MSILFRCLAVLLAAVFVLPGCSMFQSNAFPGEMSTAFTQVGTSIADQADWSRVLARLDGHVSNPGFRGGVGLEYYTYGQLIGADGSLKIEGDGEGSTMSPEVRAVIARLAEEPDAFERLLEFFKTEGDPVAEDPPGGETALEGFH